MVELDSQKKVQVNIGMSVGSIALILMVAGFAMENADYEPELGALFFTIGFWLFMIPIIVVAIIFGIIGLIMVFSR